MKRKKNRGVNEGAMVEYRRKSREEEIRRFGHPVSFSMVFRNRKKYYRKKKHKTRTDYD